MNLPEEIRNKEFGLSFRGYNVDEVEDYIEDLLERYDAVYSENAELTERNKNLTEALENAKKSIASAPKAEEQSDLREAQELLLKVQAGTKELIIKAQAEAKEIVAKAQADSKLIKEKAAEEVSAILSAAKEQSKKTAAEAAAVRGVIAREKQEKAESDGEETEISAKISALRSEYDTVKKEVEAFRAKLFKLYSGHIQMLSAIDIPALSEDSEREIVKEDAPKKSPGISRETPLEIDGEERREINREIPHGIPENKPSDKSSEEADFSVLFESFEKNEYKEENEYIPDLAEAIKLDNEKSEADKILPKVGKSSLKDIKARLYKAGAADKK